MSDIDRAELRRLLDESARPGEVFQVAYGHHYDYAVHDRAGWTVAECAGENWVRLIAAAVNALPELLDALEKAEAHRDSLAATLIEVQREKLTLERAIERVRALHVRTDEWCAYHEDTLCGCFDAYCDECEVLWPCPTIQALDGGE